MSTLRAKLQQLAGQRAAQRRHEAQFFGHDADSPTDIEEGDKSSNRNSAPNKHGSRSSSQLFSKEAVKLLKARDAARRERKAQQLDESPSSDMAAGYSWETLRERKPEGYSVYSYQLPLLGRKGEPAQPESAWLRDDYLLNLKQTAQWQTLPHTIVGEKQRAGGQNGEKVTCSESAPPSVSLQDCCFLDIETTGLSHGPGNTIFLVGLGWFDDAAFHLKLCLIEDFCEERPMLAAVARHLARFKRLVTFNGKSFDLSVLRSKAVMHALEIPLIEQGAPHLDLFPLTRALWGWLPSVKLTALEGHLLHLPRHDDLPSAQVPAAFLSFVRGEDHGKALMGRVLRHNARDIASLAAFIAPVAARLERSQFEHPGEQLGAALLLMRRRHWSEALGLLEDLERRGGYSQFWESPMEERARHALAILYRRERRYESAYTQWCCLAKLPRVSVPANRRIRYLVEIAKHLEHRIQQPARALRCVELAEGEINRGAGGAAPCSARVVAELQRRRHRLIKKVSAARAFEKEPK